MEAAGLPEVTITAIIETVYTVTSGLLVDANSDAKSTMRGKTPLKAQLAVAVLYKLIVDEIVEISEPLDMEGAWSALRDDFRRLNWSPTNRSDPRNKDRETAIAEHVSRMHYIAGCGATAQINAAALSATVAKAPFEACARARRAFMALQPLGVNAPWRSPTATPETLWSLVESREFLGPLAVTITPVGAVDRDELARFVAAVIDAHEALVSEPVRESWPGAITAADVATMSLEAVSRKLAARLCYGFGPRPEDIAQFVEAAAGAAATFSVAVEVPPDAALLREALGPLASVVATRFCDEWLWRTAVAAVVANLGNPIALAVADVVRATGAPLGATLWHTDIPRLVCKAAVAVGAIAAVPAVTVVTTSAGSLVEVYTLENTEAMVALVAPGGGHLAADMGFAPSGCTCTVSTMGGPQGSVMVVPVTDGVLETQGLTLTGPVTRDVSFLKVDQLASLVASVGTPSATTVLPPTAGYEWASGLPMRYFERATLGGMTVHTATDVTGGVHTVLLRTLAVPVVAPGAGMRVYVYFLVTKPSTKGCMAHVFSPPHRAVPAETFFLELLTARGATPHERLTAWGHAEILRGTLEPRFAPETAQLPAARNRRQRAPSKRPVFATPSVAAVAAVASHDATVISLTKIMAAAQSLPAALAAIMGDDLGDKNWLRIGMLTAAPILAGLGVPAYDAEALLRVMDDAAPSLKPKRDATAKRLRECTAQLMVARDAADAAEPCMKKVRVAIAAALSQSAAALAAV